MEIIFKHGLSFCFVLILRYLNNVVYSLRTGQPRDMSALLPTKPAEPEQKLKIKILKLLLIRFKSLPDGPELTANVEVP